MCDRNSVRVIFLILKIFILVVIPVLLYFLYKRGHKLFNVVCFLNIFFVVILIILKLAGNGCVNNSSFLYLKNNTQTKVISENPDTYYEAVYSNEQYTKRDNEKTYYYSLNYKPLKNVLLTCDTKSYMNNYGDSITGIITLIADYYGIDINEMDAITYLDDNKMIDCDNGFDFDTVFNKLGDRYSYRKIGISGSEIDEYLSDGKSILVETTNKYDEDNNFGCEKDYIVIYNKNNDNFYSIINPNDHYESYFCPSNTIGYGSIIDGDQNSKVYSFDEINSKALRYFVIEVK